MNKKAIESCIQDLIKECKNLKIPISNNIDPQIQINRKALSRFAACKKKKNSSGNFYQIEIGEILLHAEELIVRTILAHEILHTCRGCYNHGAKWKLYALQMNKNYGYRIKTTATYEELGLKTPRKEKKINYMITCQKCGNVFYRQRRSKLITNMNQYQCRCGGKLICKKITKNL